ncbi:polysaccharide biosynthesis protein [Spirochaetia bacterium]|nr:polysaccharide biosynthesis protein [Spirochaetia bacterium]
MHNLIKNTSIYALGDILPRLFSLITFPILTNYLIPDDYAIVNYVNTINTFLLIVSFLCLNTYYLVYYYRMEDEEKQKLLFGNITIFIISINFFITILLCFFGRYAFSTIGSKIDFFPYIAIGIATNFFNILGILPAALFRVQERPLPLTILNVVKSVLTMGITLVLVIRYEYKALGVLYATLIVSVIFSIVYVIITLQNMIWNINFKQIKQALLFSIPLLPGALARLVVSMSDRIFIEKHLNLFDLGIYSTASTIAMMLNIIAYGAYKAFEPYFFKIYGKNIFLASFIKVHNAFLALLIFGSMVLSVFAREFLHFFAGPGYQTAYYYVPMIQISVVFSSMAMLFSTILAAQEKTKLTSVITIVGSVVSIVMNNILLPIMGIAAACLSSGVSFGLIFILSMLCAKIQINYLRSFFGLLSSSAIAWLLIYQISFDHILFSIFFKSIGIIVSMIIIILLLQLDLRNIKKYAIN